MSKRAAPTKKTTATTKAKTVVEESSYSSSYDSEEEPKTTTKTNVKETNTKGKNVVTKAETKAVPKKPVATKTAATAAPKKTTSNVVKGKAQKASKGDEEGSKRARSGADVEEDSVLSDSEDASVQTPKKLSKTSEQQPKRRRAAAGTAGKTKRNPRFSADTLEARKLEAHAEIGELSKSLKPDLLSRQAKLILKDRGLTDYASEFAEKYGYQIDVVPVVSTEQVVEMHTTFEAYLRALDKGVKAREKAESDPAFPYNKDPLYRKEADGTFKIVPIDDVLARSGSLKKALEEYTENLDSTINMAKKASHKTLTTKLINLRKSLFPEQEQGGDAKKKGAARELFFKSARGEQVKLSLYKTREPLEKLVEAIRELSQASHNEEQNVDEAVSSGVSSSVNAEEEAVKHDVKHEEASTPLATEKETDEPVPMDVTAN